MVMEPVPTAAPSAEVVGNAFVEQYYHILHQSPGLVHRFYHESSLLSRPDSSGLMTTVTTMEAINEKILSLNYEDYTAEIHTADAQESHQNGVIVLVTGCLTGKDNVKKKFSQTFFLAPQDKGYFVLNDVFRFAEINEPLTDNSVTVNVAHEDAPSATLAPEPEPPSGANNDHTVDSEGKALNNAAEDSYPSNKGEESVIDEEVVEGATDAIQSETLASTDAAPIPKEDAPKRSYAYIVRVMKDNVATVTTHKTTTKVRLAPANFKQQSVSTAKPSFQPEASVSTGGTASESDDVREEAEGYSIYVRNLPYDAIAEQLDEVFKKFGPIKSNGIQVRSNKQGSCYGFVEFEASSSMQSALQASPINIGDHQVIIEEKRTNARVSSSSGGRGRFPSARSGFRNDSFKNRGNSGGGRGYGRNEFRNQGDYSGRGRGRGSAGHFEDDQYRGYQNSSKRGGRQGGAKGINTSSNTT